MSDETISIMGEKVRVRRESVPIDQLLFFPDNPRVYAATRDMPDFTELTAEEKQDRIYHRLLREPSVKNLRPEIERDGGLQEPVIVRYDTMQVIEGNSRLAVYRKLLEESPGDERWIHIDCRAVSGLTDDQQTRLLGQTHLIGKTAWSRYAKALYCYRCVIEENRDRATLSRMSGISTTLIGKFVKAIELMNDNDDKKSSRFSHYEVLVGTPAIRSAVDQRPALKDTLLGRIRADSIEALELRRQLPVIIAKPRILKKFEKGEVTLEDAYDRAKISGAERLLKKIRAELDDVEREDLRPLAQQEVKAVQQVVRQIQRCLKRVSGMVEDELVAKSASRREERP